MGYKNSKAQAALNVSVSIGPKASAYTGTPLAITGASTTSGSPTITLSATPAGLADGMPITLTGIPAGSTVLSFVANTSITSSANATATASALTGSINPFQAISECSSAPLSGQKIDLEDVSNFNSGQYKEYLGTMVDTGKVALDFNRVSDDPGQIALGASLNGLAYMYQIVFPLDVDQTTSGDSFIFAAILEEYDPSSTLQVGKAVKGKATLQRTGAVTFTAGS